MLCNNLSNGCSCGGCNNGCGGCGGCGNCGGGCGCGWGNGGFLGLSCGCITELIILAALFQLFGCGFCNGGGTLTTV